MAPPQRTASISLAEAAGLRRYIHLGNDERGQAPPRMRMQLQLRAGQTLDTAGDDFAGEDEEGARGGDGGAARVLLSFFNLSLWLPRREVLALLHALRAMAPAQRVAFFGGVALCRRRASTAWQDSSIAPAPGMLNAGGRVGGVREYSTSTRLGAKLQYNTFRIRVLSV